MILKAQALHNSGTDFDAWFYHYENTSFNLGGGKMVGRYPEKGTAVNESCDVIFMVLEGKGKATREDGEMFDFNKGDVFIIPKKTHYFVEADQNIEVNLWMINTPPLNMSSHIIDQNKSI
jgi:mannose-6-phosphate isomerase-like protein (cupin superfamily)